jgi:hypothetical protein
MCALHLADAYCRDDGTDIEVLDAHPNGTVALQGSKWGASASQDRIGSMILLDQTAFGHHRDEISVAETVGDIPANA